MTRSKEPVTHALVSAILLLFTQQLFAQVNFFVPISRDSVKIYFNSRGHFIDKPCAEYIRYTRISTGGVYNSYFEDVGRQGEIFGKGYYRNGKRHGAFET